MASATPRRTWRRVDENAGEGGFGFSRKRSLIFTIFFTNFFTLILIPPLVMVFVLGGIRPRT